MEVDWLGEALKYFGLLVAAGGGTAAVVFGVFQAWGKGWLDSHFNKRLEEFKHEQTKEVERLKLEINTMFDRSQRVHQLEFDAVPALWAVIVEAFEGAKKYASSFQSYSQVKNMDDDSLTWIMKEIGLNPIQIKLVLTDYDRQRAFESCVDAQRTKNIYSKMYDFLSVYRKSSIYLDEETTTIINRLNDIISSAVREHEWNINRKGDWKDTAEENLRLNGDSAFKAVQDAFKSKMKQESSAA